MCDSCFGETYTVYRPMCYDKRFVLSGWHTYLSLSSIKIVFKSLKSIWSMLVEVMRVMIQPVVVQIMLLAKNGGKLSEINPFLRHFSEYTVGNLFGEVSQAFILNLSYLKNVFSLLSTWVPIPWKHEILWGIKLIIFMDIYG